MTYTSSTLALVIVFLNIYYVISLRNEKIVGGAYAEPNEFPYHATINSSENICGGGILTKDYIVTAAHCVIGRNNEFKKEELTVIVGTTDVYGTDGIVIPVTKIFVPSVYDFGVTGADIALLQLQKSLDLSTGSKLRRLNLPHEENYSNKPAVITGFGIQWRKLQNNFFPFSKSISDQGRDGKLKYLQVKALERDECQSYFMVNCLFCIPYKSVNIDETHICSLLNHLEEPTGSCNGDSGGPLVTNGDTIIGVLSSGPLSCDDREKPTIYTRIGAFLRFIHNVWDKNYRNIRVHTFGPTRSCSRVSVNKMS